MIELSISVPEVREFIKEIIEVPGRIFEIMRFNVQETVSRYLSLLMESELTFMLGRERYERAREAVNYRNGTYHRRFTLKGIGQVIVRVPRDRNGEFRSSVLPRSKRYEDATREDLSLMFLSGVSTWTLTVISSRLIGRSISHEEVSRTNRDLTEAIERWRMRDLVQVAC
jgi:putative transposase